MSEALALFLEYGLPVLLQLAADKGVINEEQKLLMEGLAATEEFLGKLKTDDIYPVGKNGQFEKPPQTASNVNREDVSG